MPNVRNGLKRIIWLISIGASIAAWIFLFRISDISPERKINKAGIAFINWLDRHYFVDSKRITFDEFMLEKASKSKIEGIMAKIEKSVNPDSIEHWPFAWELNSQNNGKGFNVEGALESLLWQKRLRQSLKINENEIKRAFPDIRFDSFMERYSLENEPKKFARYVTLESYFKISYQRPYGRIALLILLGIVPFMAIWLLWILINWVINGFRG